MKAYLEIVELKKDITTVSEEEECCDWGCFNDFSQAAGMFE